MRTAAGSSGSKASFDRVSVLYNRSEIVIGVPKRLSLSQARASAGSAG
jgi:hypothetical protein